MSILFILGAVLAISVLIIVHEAGHYFMAKWCKMRVDRFSLGFGPGVLSWKRGETQFQIAPIPFGGFVEIRGMNIAEDIEPDDHSAYPNRPVWQRFLTIFAGPGTNYVFAIVLALALYMTAGAPTGHVRYMAGDLLEGYDAAGKLERGDTILAIQRPGETEPTAIYPGTDAQGRENLIGVVNDNGGVPVTLVVERDGEPVTVSITPKLQEAEGDEPATYLLGIRLSEKREWVPIGPIKAVGYALYYPIGQTQQIGKELYKLIERREKPQFAGPVQIGSFIKRAMETGWVQTLELLMILNVMLGLFNLFPLPALDGGRLVFLTYEMATRRRPNPKFEATVHMVGIMCLLVLMVVVTVNDCQTVF